MNWYFIIIIVAVLIEALTVFTRFFFKVSTKDVLFKLMHHYGWKKVIHFHHGFVGLIILIVTFFMSYEFGMEVGLAVALSDAIHHFVVLWIVVGDPEFQVIYKNMREFKKDQRRENRRLRRFFRKLWGN